MEMNMQLSNQVFVYLFKSWLIFSHSHYVSPITFLAKPHKNKINVLLPDFYCYCCFVHKENSTLRTQYRIKTRDIQIWAIKSGQDIIVANDHRVLDNTCGNHISLMYISISVVTTIT